MDNGHHGRRARWTMDIMDLMDGMGRARTMDGQRRAASRRWLPWTTAAPPAPPHSFLGNRFLYI
jgi:hypothetical protein